MNEYELISKDYQDFIIDCDFKKGNQIEIIFGKLNNIFFDTKFDNNILNLITLISSYFNKAFFITKETNLKGINNTINIKSNIISVISNKNLNYILKKNYVVKFDNINIKTIKNWSCEKNIIDTENVIVFNWEFDEGVFIKLISINEFYNLKIIIPIYENLKIKKNKEKIINDILLFFDKILSKIDLNDYRT